MQTYIPGRWTESVDSEKVTTEEMGFTLLELSVVILVLGIVSVFVLPRLGNFSSRVEKEREMQTIARLFKYLYNEAQLKNEQITLFFDIEGDKFWAVLALREEEEYFIPEKKLPSYLNIKDILTFQGDKITEGIVPITFYPQGYMEPVIIHLIDRNRDSYTLFFNPLTAQTRIEDGYLLEE